MILEASASAVAKWQHGTAGKTTESSAAGLISCFCKSQRRNCGQDVCTHLDAILMGRQSWQCCVSLVVPRPVCHLVTLLCFVLLAAVSDADQWYGRLCCQLPFPQQCQHACQRVSNYSWQGHHIVTLYYCKRRNARNRIYSTNSMG